MKPLLILLMFLCLTDTPAYLTGQQRQSDQGLHPDVKAAFEKMKKAALSDGVDLHIVSGYRSFDRQKSIWTRKYKKYQRQGMQKEAVFDKIVTYSTVPGTSRHHWGTDIDVIDKAASYSGDVLVPEKFHGSGPFCKMKEWMEVHAADYGFELVYTDNAHRTGFYYEPWHYSYAPLSKKYLRQYNEQIDVFELLKKEDVMGVDSKSLDRLKRYITEHINGVNPTLK